MSSFCEKTKLFSNLLSTDKSIEDKLNLLVSIKAKHFATDREIVEFINDPQYGFKLKAETPIEVYRVLVKFKGNLFLEYDYSWLKSATKLAQKPIAGQLIATCLGFPSEPITDKYVMLEEVNEYVAYIAWKFGFGDCYTKECSAINLYFAEALFNAVNKNKFIEVFQDVRPKNDGGIVPNNVITSQHGFQLPLLDSLLKLTSFDFCKSTIHQRKLALDLSDGDIGCAAKILIEKHSYCTKS